ncbi:MAG: hypothetical protein ISS70_07400 [Phycisphaerae bacterium]|nr:hypothetical protein [Phycisphaerae bacterium]
MKIYKHTFHDKKTGKKKQCKAWYISFTDNKQIRRQLPAFPSKKATERAAGKIEELLGSQGILNRDLQKWIAEIPSPMRKRLVKYGLIGDGKLSENIGKTLLVHLEEYCDGLKADRRKLKYIQQVQKQIKCILEGCRFTTWSDIDGNRVKTFLAKGRGPDGHGERTYNSYLQAFRQFCSWLIREDRVAGNNPMKAQKLIKQTTFRKVRRALTLSEQQSLLKATEAAPKRFHMDGHEPGAGLSFGA